MEYKGFFEHVNEANKTNDNITIFVSDWNKDHWAFYATIDLETFEDDIDQIQDLIKKLNVLDGDWYIEMIDYNGDMEAFYNFVYHMGYMSNSDIMDPELWNIRKDHDDELFQVARECIGTYDKEDVKRLSENGYYIAEDYEELLEITDEELYKILDKHNVLSNYDAEHHFYAWSEVTRLNDGRIVYVYA